MSSGSTVHSFSVATDRSWKDKASGEWKKQTEWVNVIAWDKKFIDKYSKGDLVWVQGRLQTRSYDKGGEKRYVTEVVAEDVKNFSAMLNGNREDSVSHASAADDVPF